MGQDENRVIGSAVLTQAAPALPKSCLKMQMVRPHPRPTESDSLGVGPVVLYFTSSLVDSCVCQSLRSTVGELSTTFMPFNEDTSKEMGVGRRILALGREPEASLQTSQLSLAS